MLQTASAKRNSIDRLAQWSCRNTTVNVTRAQKSQMVSEVCIERIALIATVTPTGTGIVTGIVAVMITVIAAIVATTNKRQGEGERLGTREIGRQTGIEINERETNQRGERER